VSDFPCKKNIGHFTSVIYIALLNRSFIRYVDQPPTSCFAKSFTLVKALIKISAAGVFRLATSIAYYNNQFVLFRYL
jgi:hypothetical protein